MVLPVVRHLADAAAVAAELWDRWLPESSKKEISATLPRGLDDGRVLFTFLAGVHDIGKITPAFTGQLRRSPAYSWVLDDLARHGLEVPARISSARPPRHCLLGFAILRSWLVRQAPGADGREAQRHADTLAGPVGAHHGVPPSRAELVAISSRDLAPTPAWSAVQDEVLDGMARRTGAAERLEPWLARDLPLSSQLALAGAVVVADWLASDQARFPLDDTESSQVRAARVLGGWDLPPPWRALAPDGDPDRLMARRFPQLAAYGIRPLQSAAAEAAHAMTRPGLIVIEAGMGEGKTEAALLAAEELAARFGPGGVVFALPTQATSDGIFPRLRDWVATIGLPVTSMFLAHGKAALNEDYRRLAANGRIAAVGDPDAPHEAIALVTSWLRGRRRGILADFVAGTIDQILFAALAARFVQLRHLALAGKVIIIDEVHAADAFMRVYLERALAWFAAHGTPVILLSATLPPDIRDSLVSAYAGHGVTCAGDAYPRLTVVDDQVREFAVAPAPGRRGRLAVRVSVDWLDEVCRAVADGGCVSVVHNTVGRAQASYEALVVRLGSDKVLLLHSRFLGIARASRERRLRQLLGPPDHRGESAHRPRGFVVVGTQVLEQSLDIDVDLMVTDIAPIDLILQRGGRVHRHHRGPDARPAGLGVPTLLVTGLDVDRHGGPPDFDPGAMAVYGAAALLRAVTVLKPHLDAAEIDLIDDLPRLVAEGYREDLPCPPGWEDAWQDAEQERRRRLRIMRADAQSFLLPAPDSRRTMVGLLADRGGEPDDDGSSTSRARVRDTDETIEVIVVRSVDGLVAPMPDAGLPVGTTLPTELGCPDDEVARRLAACTLRLPSAMTWTHGGAGGFAAVDRVIRDLERGASHLQGWAQSAWLKGELVLVLDAHNRAVVDGWELTYDTDRGLRHTKSKG